MAAIIVVVAHMTFLDLIYSSSSDSALECETENVCWVTYIDDIIIRAK